MADRSRGSVFAPQDASHVVILDGDRFGEKLFIEVKAVEDFSKVYDLTDAFVRGVDF